MVPGVDFASEVSAKQETAIARTRATERTFLNVRMVLHSFLPMFVFSRKRPGGHRRTAVFAAAAYDLKNHRSSNAEPGLLRL